MNLGQLRVRTRMIASAQSEVAIPDPYINDLLNESHADVCGVRDWPWLRSEETAVSVGDTVTLPTVLRGISRVEVDGVGVRLEPVTVAWIDEAREYPNATEHTSYARVGDGELRLWPPVGDNVTVNVTGLLAAVPMTSDIDEPMFEDSFHHILAYAAAARLLIEHDDQSRAEGFGAEVAGLLQRMQAQYVQLEDEKIFQMGGGHRQSSTHAPVHRRGVWR